MRRLKAPLTHPWLALAFRLYIAGIFIYASMYKISFAGEFANSIAEYRLVPFWAVNPMAVALPWIELVCALLMLIGFRHKASTAVLGALLALFAVAVAVNVLRDTPASCGCFHSMEDVMSWRTVLRDLLWLGMAAHVYFFDRILLLDQTFLPSLGDLHHEDA